MESLPKRFQKFSAGYPQVALAHQQLGEAVRAAGPLEAKTRELAQLAVAVGARMEGAVHSHTRKALEAGCSPAEIRQTVLLAIPMIGFPAGMAALSWVDDILDR